MAQSTTQQPTAAPKTPRAHRVSLYLRFKALLPKGLRSVLSSINQRFFARTTIQRRYGAWFDVDWRKRYSTLSNEEWIRAYDEVWKRHHNDCVDETDTAMILGLLGSAAHTPSVLEVGCGAGSLACAMAKAGFRVTCVDVSGEALSQAERRAAAEGVSLTVRQGFAESLPFADKTFDVITCCHTLEHVKDLAAATSELKRVARQKLIVLVPRQEYRLYADNYHTQFFSRPEHLIEAFAVEQYECRALNFLGRDNEFQGEALLFVGYLV